MIMKSIIYRFGNSLKRMMNNIAGILIIAVLLMGIGVEKANASENGDIKVAVLDEDGGPGIGATVTVLSAGQEMAKTITNNDGIATFREIMPGTYDIRIEMLFMATQIKTGISVAANKTSYLDLKMTKPVTSLDTLVITPAFETMAQTTFTSGNTIDEMQFKNSATDRGNIPEIIVATTPGILLTPDGKDLYSRGARKGTTEYIIDGEKVIGSFEVPSQSVKGMTVYTGGIPAAYGDLTGGLVMITTKSFFNGVQSKKRMYDDISRHMQENKEYLEGLKKEKEEKK